jgi:hypothetical protein
MTIAAAVVIGSLKIISHLLNGRLLQVDHSTGERYRKFCLDHGNRPHTVAKKIRQLRAMISAGIERNQLETNPLIKVKTPRVPTNTIIRTYTPDERQRLIKAASEFQDPDLIEWNLLILIALTTAVGLRKQRGSRYNHQRRNHAGQESIGDRFHHGLGLPILTHYWRFEAIFISPISHVASYTAFLHA